MALLITKQNRPVFVTAEQAALLWLVKTGERKGTFKTRIKANQIAKWYLNREKAPESWKHVYPPIEERKRRQFAANARLPYID